MDSTLQTAIKSRFKKQVVKNTWLCDKCRLVRFDNYEDACRHEEKCTDPRIDLSSKIVKSSSKLEDNELNIIETSLSSDDFSGADGEEPPDLPTISSALSSDSRSESDRNMRTFLSCPSKTTKEIKIPKKNKGKFKSQVNSLSMVDLNCNFNTTENSSLKEMTGKRNNKNKYSPPQRKSLRRSCRNISSKESNVNHIDMTVSENAETERKHQKKGFGTSSSRRINSRMKGDANSHINTYVEQDIPINRRNKSEKSLASIFLSGPTELKPVDLLDKTVLAEHQSAEYMINRRQKAELERDQKFKRQKARQKQRKEDEKQRQREEIHEVAKVAEYLKQQKMANQIFVTKENKKKNTKEKTLASIFTNPSNNNRKDSAKSGIDCSSTTEISSKRQHVELDAFKLMSSLKQASTKRESSLKSSNSVTSLPSYLSAPKYPIPNHITGEGSINVPNLMKSEDMYHLPLLRTLRHQHSLCNDFGKEIEDFSESLLENCCIWGKVEVEDSSKLLHQLFRSILCPPAIDIDAKDEDSIIPGLLWSEKYSVQNIPHGILGTNNKAKTNELETFINDWKNHRKEMLDSRKEKMKNTETCKSRNSNYYSDDLWEYDSDEEDNDLCKVVLVSGPTGSGKTSLVHAVAKKCQCVAHEINTSMARGGQALKMAIEESTQSHSNLAILRKDKNNECDYMENFENTNTISLALVLIDEVDLLFEDDGDSGFWLALCNLVKKAKCPIILTASEVPNALEHSSIQYKHIPFERPTPMECASKIAQISSMENMSWMPRNPNSTKEILNTISTLCNCDLRKIMNEMQLFRHSVTTTNCEFFDHETERVMPKAEIEIQPPQIFHLSPTIVPSDKFSIITIKGNNFPESHKVEIIIGDQKCPEARIINSKTIFFICPPRIIYEGVDCAGLLHANFEQSLSCQFAPVFVKFISGKGLVFKSDMSLSRIDSSGNFRNPLYVTYSFPDQYSSKLETTEKDEIKGKSSKKKLEVVSKDGFLSSDDDDFVQKMPLEKDESDDLNQSKALIEADDNTDNDDMNAMCISSLDSTRELMGNMIKEYLPSLDSMELSCTKVDNDSTVSLISPIRLKATSNQPKHFKDDLRDFCRSTEMLSDAALLEDSSNLLFIPMLSGVVPGFGTDLVDDSTVLRNTKGKPPSMDKLINSGLNESNFFFGSQDFYLSQPRTHRDRSLLVDAYNNLRGGSPSHGEISNQLLTKNNAEDNSSFPIDQKETLRDDEDCFLPSNKAVPLACLPPMLRDEARSTCNDGVSTMNEAKILLACNNKVINESLLDSAVFPLIGNERISSRHGAIYEELVLDYYPMLCKMAYFESRFDLRFDELSKNIQKKW
eukprot:CAMPEP_0184860866 /NCGR_PEP_ID=MMETSP0580-20130426/5668_1 /TAXON_ID=1118495 /ORGANISM="Dactyliosolen fragilissimus" /LENGTH=1341 /DNA_ID=CAMNT_0027358127 /DNA_START=102 /DNA_END=4128 /DNA_ORIENTATION=+